MVRRVASLVTLVLLLLTAAPVMACVTGTQMSQSESACCLMMHGQCGDMAKTGCCRVDVKDQDPQRATHASTVTPHLVAVLIVSLNLASPQTALPARWIAPDQHSPPLPRSTQPTALRI